MVPIRSSGRLSLRGRENDRLSEQQSAAAEAIVNIFESGSVLGDYSQVTLIPGDTGRLTYGRSQTTLGSGGLHQLTARYCHASGVRFGAALEPYLPRLRDRAREIDADRYLHNLLRAAADDPVMRSTQDAFFDDQYWQPAVANALAMGIASPLGVAVVYDSRVHGSFWRIRERTHAVVGEPKAAGEQTWVKEYVRQRKTWLSNHSRSDLRKTTYRMDANRHGRPGAVRCARALDAACQVETGGGWSTSRRGA